MTPLRKQKESQPAEAEKLVQGEGLQQEKPPVKKDRRLIKYLAYLLVVTTMVTSGTLAKFVGEEKATASAKIAAYAAGSTYEIDLYLGERMQPGSSETIEFTVENYDENDTRSETSLGYSIEIITTGNLPLQFSLSGTGASGDRDDKVVGALNSTNLTATGGRLPVGSETKKAHRYTLTVQWPQSEANTDYSNEIDMLTIKVSTAQTDPTKT